MHSNEAKGIRGFQKSLFGASLGKNPRTDLMDFPLLGTSKVSFTLFVVYIYIDCILGRLACIVEMIFFSVWPRSGSLNQAGAKYKI